MRNYELILVLAATALLVSVAMISVKGQAPGAGPAPVPPAAGAVQATEFGALRAAGPGGAVARGSSAINDVQATALLQIEIESYREIDAMTNAVNDLRAAAYSLTPNAEEIRAKAAALANAQLNWGLKTSELFSRVQASPQRLTPAAVDEHVTTPGGGARRGGPRRGGPTFTEPQISAMMRLVQDSSAEAAAVTNALVAFRRAVYAAPSNPTEVRAKTGVLSGAQLIWALKVADLLASVQSSAQKLPAEAVIPLVTDTVTSLVPTAPAAAPAPAPAPTNAVDRGAAPPGAGGGAP